MKKLEIEQMEEVNGGYIDPSLIHGLTCAVGWIALFHGADWFSVTWGHHLLEANYCIG